jgi:hypothetical protein
MQERKREKEKEEREVVCPIPWVNDKFTSSST